MSGGDDLESDDEYLSQNWHANEEIEVTVDDSTKDNNIEGDRQSKKGGSLEIGEADDAIVPKAKKDKFPRQLLLEG